MHVSNIPKYVFRNIRYMHKYVFRNIRYMHKYLIGSLTQGGDYIGFVFREYSLYANYMQSTKTKCRQ